MVGHVFDDDTKIGKADIRIFDIFGILSVYGAVIRWYQVVFRFQNVQIFRNFTLNRN